MDIRMARLESAYEQIDRRLRDLRNDVNQRLSDMRHDFDERFTSLELRMDNGFARIDQKFIWMLGLIFGTWVTTIVTILLHR